MNESIPDIVLPKQKWVELFTATRAVGAAYGLATGTPISLQNKSQFNITLFEQENMPGQNSRSGTVLKPLEKIVVLGGSKGVWAISRKEDGAVFIQEMPQ